MLWIAGFDVLPLAHIAFHEAFGEHQHGAHQAHDRASGLSDHAPHDHGDRHAETDDPESDLPDPDHGRGSLAHRDLAAQAAQACIPPVREARVAYLAPRVSALEDDPSRVRCTASRARAPPES